MYSGIEEQELSTDQEFSNNQVVYIVTLDSIDNSYLGTMDISKAVQWLKDELTNFEKGHIKDYFFCDFNHTIEGKTTRGSRCKLYNDSGFIKNSAGQNLHRHIQRMHAIAALTVVKEHREKKRVQMGEKLVLKNNSYNRTNLVHGDIEEDDELLKFSLV